MEMQGYNPITYEKRNILECVMESVGRHPDRTAVVFEPDDEQSVRHALTQLLDQHDFARQLAVAAQEHVKTHHSVSQMVSATLRTYLEVQQLHKD